MADNNMKDVGTKFDNDFRNTINDNMEELNTRMGRIIAQPNDANTEILDARDGKPTLYDKVKSVEAKADDNDAEINLARENYTDLNARLNYITNTANNGVVNGQRLEDRSVSGSKIKTADDADKIGLTELKQEVRDAMAGTTTIGTTPADGAVTNTKIADGAVTNKKLADNYNNRADVDGNNGGDFNTALKSGIYLFLNSPANVPGGMLSGTLYVERVNNRWIYQRATALNSVTTRYERWIDLGSGTGGTFSAWIKVDGDQSVTNAMLKDGIVGSTKLTKEYNYHGVLGTEELSTKLNSGLYTIGENTVATDKPPGIVTGFLFVMNLSSFVIQEVTSASVPTDVYRRTVRPGYSNGVWERVISGPNQVTSRYIPDKSIPGTKMDNKGDYRDTLTDADLGVLYDAGSYLINAPYTNGPAGFTSSARLIVNAINSSGRWVMQTLWPYMDPKKYYIRTLDKENPTPTKAWTEVHLTGNRSDIDGSKGGDFNTATDPGVYLFLNNPTNVPGGYSSGTLYVERVNNRWIYQRAMKLNNVLEQYERVIDWNNGNATFYPWYRKTVPDQMSLQGKKIVNFGDSIFGNTQGSTSISGYISSLSGATAYNVGFGGCRMSDHSQYWDAFSMYRLADAICDQNFTLQDDAVLNGTSLPSYFGTHVETLKSIDFNTVDFITIAYGTNDYTAGKEIDNPADPEDITYFMGALRYSLRRIFETYPHIKILVCTPTYRFWLDGSGNISEDSDTKTYNTSGDTLDAFVVAVKDGSKEFKTPHLDQYYELGFNKYNRTAFFSGTDGTHPISTGREKMAKKICSALVSQF